MSLNDYLSVGTLIVAIISVVIAALAFIKQRGTRQLAFASFQKELKAPYLNWRDHLGTIDLDPPPGNICRTYTEEERRKIRDYWPKVTLIELELLKSVDKKLIMPIWSLWKANLTAGIGHRSILQEFCYYERYEDTNYGDLRNEMIEIVHQIYKENNNKTLDCNFVLSERKEYTAA